jgi:hypothetical protein
MIIEKLQQINKLIDEVAEEDTGVANVLRDCFGLSFNILEAVAKNNGNISELDVSDQITLVSETLGIDMEQLVIHAITEFNDQMDLEQKAADEQTLAFITADEDVDDYERFIEENNVKENLDFLKGEV